MGARCADAVPLILLLLVPCLVADVACSGEPAARPELNRPFANPVFDEWVARFERPGREIFDRRYNIVKATGVKEGMQVADVGAGTGLFTFLFAEAVGTSGTVYAVDISKVFIDNILRRSDAGNQSNVIGVVNSAADVALPAASVDLVFVCDTYHHFERPMAMLASIRLALKPGGSLVVIDFRRIPGYSSSWVMGHVRAGKSVVVGEIESAGFNLVEDRDFLVNNYFLRFSPRL